MQTLRKAGISMLSVSAFLMTQENIEKNSVC
jgi:hypothetical protein